MLWHFNVQNMVMINVKHTYFPYYITAKDLALQGGGGGRTHMAIKLCRNKIICPHIVWEHLTSVFLCSYRLLDSLF